MGRKIVVKKSGVYCIENIINNKKYIGQSYDLSNRFLDHKNLLKNNHHRNKHLQNSFNKHGADNFKFYIIDLYNIDVLNIMEVYWIEFYNTMDNRCGYNKKHGGNNGYLSEDTKRNLSESHKNPSEEKRKNMSVAHLGKIQSEESKLKKSLNYSGVNHSLFGKKRPNSSSDYFGVSKHQNKNWVVSAYNSNLKKRVYLGIYETEEVAAQVYNDYVIENDLSNPLNIFKLIEEV